MKAAKLPVIEVENYIDDYIDMGLFKKPEEGKPYLMDGFEHGYAYAWQTIPLIDKDCKYIDENLPPENTVVLATIQPWHTKGLRTTLLKHVKEDDVSWRFLYDNAELIYDWSVIEYTRLPGGIVQK